MAYYDKKVVYLSYLKYGSKIKNAGFVKIENLNGNIKMDMRVTNLSAVKDNRYDISVITHAKEEYVIGKIYIHKGSGEWNESFRNEKIGEKSINYNELNKIYLKISDGEVIEGQIAREGVRPEKSPVKEPELKAGSMTETVKPVVNTFVSTPERQETEPANVKPIEMENIILNDKWKQLMQVYPVVHPYEDNREYISIEPKDFVIMSGDYQHLANNSFLLHGFYNYRHIILGKEQESGNPDGSFYLGVPGVYYEREKMVALMFGFEAFECIGGKAEPGKFGYYLRKVKI